jgi:hypothetical protein
MEVTDFTFELAIKNDYTLLLFMTKAGTRRNYIAMLAPPLILCIFCIIAGGIHHNSVKDN